MFVFRVLVLIEYSNCEYLSTINLAANLLKFSSIKFVFL